MQQRGQFSSRLGFILAAAGSAVGLGNIWGFPTQTASNGGAAFLLIYLALIFVLAYPVLCAELLIGRHGQSNPVASMQLICSHRSTRKAATLVGLAGMITVSGILSFYAIVAGWMIAFMGEPLALMVGAEQPANWMTSFGVGRNLLFTAIFMLFTIWVVNAGVKEGIEKWSRRLMPALLVLLLLLIGYLLTQEGAADGLKAYLVPDWSHLSPELLLKAMGQSFFSLSLGVGTMMIYGSYLSRDENLPKLAAQVTLVDTGVAVLAGMLIMPAMYVALHNGVEIFDANGALISSGDLVFQVLPALFDTMGSAGLIAATVFFLLMSIAALTSSISMLEVPVAYVAERFALPRAKAGYLVGGAIMAFSVLVIFNFGFLFGKVISITTEYAQPLIGLMFAVFTGWVWKRNRLLNELRQSNPEIEQGLFWKIWPTYVKFICPLLIGAVVLQSLM